MCPGVIAPHLYCPAPIVPVAARFFIGVFGGTGAVPGSAMMSTIGENGATRVILTVPVASSVTIPEMSFALPLANASPPLT